MDFINKLKIEAKQNKKKIVLPETDDIRILEAATKILEEDLVNLVLFGNKETIINEYPILDKAEWIDINNYPLKDEYINRLYELRKEKSLTLEEATDLINNNKMYFACMLLLDKKADGIVYGINHSSSDTLSPALRIVKGKGSKVSSFFIMETDKKELGENGIFIFADCGLIQQPTSSELCEIATHSINSYKELINDNPKVAFLSHSTYDSSKHEMIDKVKEAVNITKMNNPEVLIDGELQLDAAIIPEVSLIKCPSSPLKGGANILIFPDIDSGNIGYKLVERFSNTHAYGPLTQGLKYPINDLSRGSTVEDIIGVVLITSIQASKNMIQ